MTETLLTTGQAARLLSASRQHVVDLCDRGELGCVLVGAHRRIPSTEVERLTGPELTRERAKSLWLHWAVLGELAADPDAVITVARTNLERWRGQHRPDGRTREHLDRWGDLLNAGPDVLARSLVDRSMDASELRQSSPFAGVLTDERRAQVLRAFRSQWDRDHASTAASGSS